MSEKRKVIVLKDELLKQCEEVAKQKGLTLGSFVRYVLVNYLNQRIERK